MKQRLVEFQPPAGAVPEGTGPGEDFDATCTFRVKDGGTICLVMLGETKMPGYDKRDQHKAGYSDYAQSMAKPGSDQMTMEQDKGGY